MKAAAEGSPSRSLSRRARISSWISAAVAALWSLIALLAPLSAATLAASVPTPAAAQTSAQGWCTVVGPGTHECFGSPIEACQRQWQVYNPNKTFLGTKDSETWYIKFCDWTPEGGPGSGFVDFRCDTYGDTSQFPGVCSVGNGFASRPAACQCRLTTKHPIDLVTGAKLFSDLDYETATGLQLTRQYASSFGFSTVNLQFEPLGLANWQYDFQIEMQIVGGWPTPSRLVVALPRGELYSFERLSTGAMVPYEGNGQGPQTDYRLSFVGAWPSDLNSITTASSQWLLRDRDETQWEITTFPNHVNGKFTVGRPTKMTDRNGRTITFQYDTSGKLSSMADAYGNTIGFTWNATSHPTLKEAILPGGYKLAYSYWNDIRLTDVKIYDAANVLLDQRTYEYADTRFQRSVTGILDKDGVKRWSATYDDRGRAISSSGPGGVEATTVSYASTTTRVVTNALGQQTTYTLVSDGNSARPSSEAAAATANVPAMTQSKGYNSSKVMNSTTDYEGRVTQYTYDDPRVLPTQIVEASGTPQARTTTVVWDSNVRQPVVVTTPTLKTEVNLVAAGSGAPPPPPPPTTTAHRYWRIKIIDAAGVSGSTYYANLATVQLFEAAAGGDQALGTTATSSTSVSATYAADKGNDGDVASYASLTNGASPPPFADMWWQADFGASPKLIKAAAISAPTTDAGATPVNFRVEWSDDAVTWSQQWAVIGQYAWHKAETRLFVDPTYSYSGSFWGAHSYWRLLATERTGGGGSYSAAELQYRASPGGANQASGGTPTASSQYSTSWAPTKAHDGLTTTAWDSGTAGSTIAWIQYQFTAPVSVGEIRWTARSDAYPHLSPTGGLVLYSDDGTSWRPAFTLKKPSGWTAGQTFDFADPAYVP
jgi:YD repeat-containing protein